MRILLSWIKDFIDIDKSPREIAETLTRLGIEVEGISSSGLQFSGVIVGEVLDTIAHPSADRLKIATVDSGTEKLQVVCGAANCRAGIKTALATIGAEIQGEDKRFKIKKGKLRGIESFGMLCAADELGLPITGSGIIELPTHLQPGTPLENLYADTIFDIALTPNLGHCQSHLGIARELSAAYNIPYKRPSAPSPISSELHTSEVISVSIDSPDQCSRYCCLALDNVTIEASPSWLRERVENAGIRSINNIVDITNYVMLELGQPLHAFDLDRIEGQQITVRTAEQKTPIITLDGEEKHLEKGTLLIWDAAKPIAIAGVMGAENTKTTSTTTRVLLEAAHFTPASVRFSSRKNNIRTDSSTRFERNLDPTMVPFALKRAASLIQELCGANIAMETIDEYQPTQRKQLHCRPKRINTLLGTHLSLSECQNIFERLDMKVTQNTDETLTLTIPSYRNDLKEEIDLVEEIGRIHGYHHIPLSPPKIIYSTVNEDPFIAFEKKLRETLIAEGLQELLTCDLISASEASVIGGEHLAVLSPSSQDQSLLRKALLPGMLSVVKHNQNLGAFDLCGFEIGHVHFIHKEKATEQRALAFILSGSRNPAFWEGKETLVDFFDAKGILENLLAHCSTTPTLKTSHETYLHPKRQATIHAQETPLGYIGEVHPHILNAHDIEGRIYYAEIQLAPLLEPFQTTKKMSSLPQFPSTYRDWTITVPKNLTAQKIYNAIQEAPSRLLKNYQMISLYEGKNTGEHKKNLTFRFIYRDDKKTLCSEAVDKEHNRLIASIQKNFA